MKREFYYQLADDSLQGRILDNTIAQEILSSPDIELLSLLNAVYQVRKHFHGQEVHIHIINNAQNGFCPEDCHYCAQAKSAKSGIEDYPLKSEEEILAEAKHAYESGAFRYCMVFAGRGPSLRRVEFLARLIRKIKALYPIEICISAGLLDEEKAKILKEAGLDRLNHNLNTSRRHYPNICTTHTYDDRLRTLQAAQKVGIELCSGIIVGMGETHEDILEVAYTLRRLEVPSIPVNFLIPIQGTQIKVPSTLTPDYCLRVLCVFRFINPQTELRIAAGRELHLRSMEVLALYPANSLFMEGYLNAKGSSRFKTLQMIKDAGFTIKSDHSIEELLAHDYAKISIKETPDSEREKILLKGLKELRPYLSEQEKTTIQA